MKTKLAWFVDNHVSKFFRTNPGLKALAVLVAIGLWASQQTSSRDIGAFVSMPIVYRGMPADLEISSELIDTVSVDIRGPEDTVEKFKAAPASIALDFSALHGSGEFTFHITESNVNLPSRVRLIRAVPSVVRYRFENTLVRTVPIVVRWKSPPPGWGAVAATASPSEVAVKGPKSRVESILSVQTDTIDLSGVDKPVETTVNAFIENEHVRFVEPVRITVRLEPKQEP